MPSIKTGDVGASTDLSDIGQAQRTAAVDADHEVSNCIGIDQEAPCGNWHGTLRADALANLFHRVGGLQGLR